MGQSKQDICIAKIVSAHGVHGGVKLKVFSDDPEGLLGYKQLKDQNGLILKIKKARPNKADSIIVKFEGPQTREHAESLVGTELFVNRGDLPELDEDEFYVADLIGMAAQSSSGIDLGTVVNVENHGAGDFITLSSDAKNGIPFTLEAVPDVNIKGNFIVVSDEFLAKDDE